MRLLATKILAPEFKERLIQQDFSVIEYPFIKIRPLPFPKDTFQKHIILTSQHATQLLLEQASFYSQLNDYRFFCVGEKSAKMLKAQKARVLEIAPSASVLAETIRQSYSDYAFSYCCGHKRLSIIETQLGKAKIILHIQELYNTILNPKQIKTTLDGILFYSPSAVESYLLKNKIDQAHCFCIGTTTAKKVRQYTQNYSVAKAPHNNFIFLDLMQHYHA